MVVVLPRVEFTIAFTMFPSPSYTYAAFCSGSGVGSVGMVVAVGVGVGPVGEAVGDEVTVFEAVGVMEGVRVMVAVGVMEAVGVTEGVKVSDAVGDTVGDKVEDAVNVREGVKVIVGVLLAAGWVAVWVASAGAKISTSASCKLSPSINWTRTYRPLRLMVIVVGLPAIG